MRARVINRNVRGIEVNDETLSLDVIANVCIEGPGHYLGHDQTLSLRWRENLSGITRLAGTARTS